MRGKRGAERRTLHIFPVRPLPAKRTAHGPEFPRRLILAAADGKRLWGSGLEGVLKARVAAAISAATAEAATASAASAPAASMSAVSASVVISISHLYSPIFFQEAHRRFCAQASHSSLQASQWIYSKCSGL